MLDDVIDLLRCPHCLRALLREGDVVRCAQGHSFDVARQGYLSLLPGDARLGTADSARMVAAREAFLGAGHFDRLGERVAQEAGRHLAGEGCVVDVGAGTGWYLARTLERSPGPVGLALDLSGPALRRAARAHPRIGAVRCDAWRPLPLRDEVAALALDVFAPRNGAELARVLLPGGALLVVTPLEGHLAELVTALGLLEVDARKAERLAGQLDRCFERLRHDELTWPLRLAHGDVRDAVTMGPSAPHTSPDELDAAIGSLPDPIEVTAEVAISLYRRRDSFSQAVP